MAATGLLSDSHMTFPKESVRIASASFSATFFNKSSLIRTPAFALQPVGRFLDPL